MSILINANEGANNPETARRILTQPIRVADAVSLNQLIHDLEEEPEEVSIWKGIQEGSFGFVYGSSKSGKTVLCENLGMSIAAGLNSYLGHPINLSNRKVFMVSIEEFWKKRTKRNRTQRQNLIQQLSEEQIEMLDSNFVVAGKGFPRHFVSNREWNELSDLIIAIDPGLVIIDSMTRLHSGKIETTEVSKEVSQKLRNMQNDLGITLIVIHHSPKEGLKPITIDSLAGSRVLAQEADFGIGVKKAGNRRYIKDVFYRYADDSSESVQEFRIPDSLWCESQGFISENAILKSQDGRTDDLNRNLIIDTSRQLIESSGSEVFTTSSLENKLTIEEGKMDRSTIYENVKKLVDTKVFKKVSKGKYTFFEEDN